MKTRRTRAARDPWRRPRAIWDSLCERGRGVGEGARRATGWIGALWRQRPGGREPGSSEPASPRGLDLVLLFVILSLLGLGMTLIYTSSAVFAQANYGSSTFFLRRNLIYGAVGLVALYLGWRIDYRLYQRLAYPLLLGCVGLLVALLVPGLGTRVDGATRWFHLAGISIQPSEPAKFALMVYLAYSLSKKQDTMRVFTVGFLPHLCVAGLIALLILRQPDLGTAVVLATVTLLLLFVAGTKLSYLVISLLAAAPLAYQLIVGTPWRMRRLLAYLDPWAYRHDAGYQISESLISIGSGGLWGLGLGDGKQKLFFLPAAHTDFIFAIAGEELGFVGLLTIVCLFALLIARGLRAAFGARELFGTYLAFGLTSTYGLQALLHLAVVLGLVPTKGITLPLVSYGGSALVTALFCMGVLLNIAARRPLPEKARGSERRPIPVNRKRPSRVMVSDAPEVRSEA